MTKLLKLLFLLLSVLIVSVGILFFFITDNSATTKQQQILSATTAANSKQVVSRLYRQLERKTLSKQIYLTEQEIQALLALGHRAFPVISAQANVTKMGSVVSASIKLPVVKRFINISLWLMPSEKGLLISDVDIGSLQISGNIFVDIVRWGLNTLIKEYLGNKLVDAVQQVSFGTNYLVLNLAFQSELMDSNNQDSLVNLLRKYIGFAEDVPTIDFYHLALADWAVLLEKSMDKSNETKEELSLANFINFLFSQVQERVTANNDLVLINENKAALLALTSYFGDFRVKSLIGQLAPLPRQQAMIRNKLREQVTLQGRVDLQKHFAYSVALQLFSNTSASDAIGEFKEFLDSNQGGSGFSFADLLADRAGTRLAIITLSEQDVALKAMTLLVDANDADVLPEISDLKEGISAEHFEREYQDVNSNAYQAALIHIDNKLKTLPLYQLGW